jgi:hypothetical protein
MQSPRSFSEECREVCERNQLRFEIVESRVWLARERIRRTQSVIELTWWTISQLGGPAPSAQRLAHSPVPPPGSTSDSLAPARELLRETSGSQV